MLKLLLLKLLPIPMLPLFQKLLSLPTPGRLPPMIGRLALTPGLVVGGLEGSGGRAVAVGRLGRRAGVAIPGRDTAGR